MARTKNSSSRKLATQVQRRRRRKEPRHNSNIDPDTLISSGCSLLNCALSDLPDGGYLMGSMVNTIGDSSSGKTFEALTTYAEAGLKPGFDNYRFLFDDVENRNSFNLDYLFSPSIAARFECPGEEKPSDTIQEFHHNILTALEADQPFIYTLDSFDALGSDEDNEKVDEMREALVKGNKPKGTYGMEKAKASSRILRQICGKLSQTHSFLNIISQTRDNTDPTSFSKKTRSGGRALKFYATHELWFSSKGPITRKNRVVGVKACVKVTKNSLTGKVREVDFPIYYDYGVDDIGASIDFLLKEGYWGGGGSAKIKTKDTFSIDDCTRDKMIKEIEEQDAEPELRELVGKVWSEIEASLLTKRKRKY